MSNANFRKVENIAGPLSELVASDAKLSNAEVADLEAGNASIASQVFAPVSSPTGTALVQKQLVGYSPVPFTGAAPVSLNLAPGQPWVISGATGGLALLPVGAIVLDVVASNNGTVIVGPASFDVGSAALNTTSATLFTTILLATVNAGGAAHNATALGSAGLTSTVVDGFLSADPATAPTSGDMRVVVQYLQLV